MERVKLEDALSEHIITNGVDTTYEFGNFETPAPIDGGEYWQYVPFPKKALFREILMQGQDPAPLNLAPEPDVDALELEVEMTEDPKEKQHHLLQLAALRYEWEKAKDVANQPVIQSMMTQNERKASQLINVKNHLDNLQKRSNELQVKVLRSEIGKAIHSVGGTDELPDPETLEPGDRQRVETMQANIGQVLSKLGEVTQLKSDINRRRKEINSVAKPLKKHLKIDRQKYQRTGNYTKVKRAAIAAKARPYNQSGKHIKDFQNPRFEDQRNQQLREYAERLRQAPDLIEKSLVTGK